MTKEFKIEIWRFNNIVDTYESNNIKEVQEWFDGHWRDCYNYGGCAYELYKNNEYLSYEQIRNLGFED